MEVTSGRPPAPAACSIDHVVGAVTRSKPQSPVLTWSAIIWLLTFIVLILSAVVIAVYAMRGVIRSLSKTRHRHDRHHPAGE